MKSRSLPIKVWSIQWAISIAFVGLSGCQRKTESLSVTYPIVTAASAEWVNEFPIEMTYYGRIEANRSVELGFEQAGLVTNVSVHEGHRFSSGQELARIDTQNLQAERRLLSARRQVEIAMLDRVQYGERVETIAAAKAEVDRLEADVELAARNRKRISTLAPEGVATRAQFDEAVLKHESLVSSLESSQQRYLELKSGNRREDIDAQIARLAAADAEIAAIDVKLAKATLVAPFAGSVVRRCVDEGAFVSAGQAVLKIQEHADRNLRFFIPLDHARAATSVKEVSAQGRLFPVQSFRLIGEVNEMTRTVEIVYVVEATQTAGLVTGDSSFVRLTHTVSQPSMRLKLKSLIPSVRGLWCCYVLHRTSQFDGDQPLYEVQKRELQVLHADGDEVFAAGKLDPLCLVVTSGANKVVPGMLVKLGQDSLVPNGTPSADRGVVP